MAKRLILLFILSFLIACNEPQSPAPEPPETQGDLELTVSPVGTTVSLKNVDIANDAADYRPENRLQDEGVETLVYSLEAATYSVTVEAAGYAAQTEETIVSIGETSSLSVNLEALPPGTPSASFTASTLAGNAPLTVDFDATASRDAEGDLKAYLWDFGDGTSATGVKASHTFASYGEYTVMLSVTDEDDLSSSTSKKLFVNALPTAEFAFSSDALALSLDASASSDPDGSVEAYDWTFEDGETASGVKLTHTFAEAGDYDVILTVTDDKGAQAALTRSVSVKGTTDPDPDPEPEPTTGLKPLTVSADGRNLLKGGEPFIWHADTAWQLFATTNQSELELYLDDVAAKGFTVVQVFMTAIWSQNNDTPNAENAAGEQPFIDNDPTKLNPKYFDYMALAIQEAAERGLYTAVMFGEPARTNNDPLLPYALSSKEQAYNYAYALGERFREPTLQHKIIWFNGQDRNPTRDLGEDVWLALSEGLADGVNAVKNLNGQADYSSVFMSYHEDGHRTLVQPFFTAEPWLDFYALNTYQHYYSLVANVQARYDATPKKPIVCIEQAYEDSNRFGEAKTPWSVRFQGYWCYLSGAVGYAYGHNDGQYVADGPSWPGYFNDEGRLDMAHLKALISSRTPEKRVPDQSLIVSDPGQADQDKDYIAAARANDGSYAFVYATNGRGFSVDLSKLSGSQVRAQWFDPRDGSYQAVATFAKTSSQAFTPPGTVGPDNDWLLVLDAQP